MTKYSEAAAIKAGGRPWGKGSMRRVYFDAANVMRIDHAAQTVGCMGPISKAAIRAICAVKVWWEDGEVHTRGDGDYRWGSAEDVAAAVATLITAAEAEQDGDEIQPCRYCGDDVTIIRTDGLIDHANGSGQVTCEDYLDIAGAAEHLGVRPETVTRYRTAGVFPVPDMWLGRSPGWLPSTLDVWRASRPGRGAGGGRPRKDRTA